MTELRRLSGAILVTALLAATPAGAQEDIQLVGVSPATYVAMFDDADLRGLEMPSLAVFALFDDITGDQTLDERIRDAAEGRGYRRQPIATADLARVEGRRLQPAAAEAWIGLKSAAEEAGVGLVLTSAHRDFAEQQALFLGRLAGRTSESAIDAVLRTAAPPGYSRHHTGFAIDVGEAGVNEGGFVNTAAYAWLAAFDFAVAKAFGFIPSYPQGGIDMGPDPEPWELVWVGPGRVACSAEIGHPTNFCDSAATDRADDIAWLVERGVTVGCRPGRFCSDDTITRGEAASMLWRLHGAPQVDEAAPFGDVFREDHYATAVRWLWSLGVVGGTSATTFSPDDPLTPGDALAIVVRLAMVDDRPAPTGILDPPAGSGPASAVGDPGLALSRAEFASVLRAVAAG